MCRVWDPVVRILHWALAVSVAAAWLTKEGWGRYHEWIGYAALALVAARIAWGFVGPSYARFAQFACAPPQVLHYAARVLARTEPRHIGHNPLGGWMVVTLIVAVLLSGVSGWLYTTDAFWGVEWVERLHDALATLLLVLVAAHIAGVVFTSIRHRENLVGSMLHGRKRAPQSTDVE